MPLSPQILRLQSRWQSGAGWPKRLNWIQIKGLRGWVGQQFDINFPIMALVGENGCGKSTVLHMQVSSPAALTTSTRRPTHSALTSAP